jgi:Tfp pilus assembly protein PilV
MKIQKNSEKGFSYIDVMIAIVILTVGILAMASALTTSLIRSYESEKRVVAKQLALSTVESIISAKEIKRADVIEGWDSIRNIQTNSQPINGIFMTGWRPVREENGWDGVAGTIDDACDAPGSCAVANRTTNSSPVIKGVERQIVITDVEDPERPSPPNEISRRRIDVTVRFSVNQAVRQETVSTILAKYK